MKNILLLIIVCFLNSFANLMAQGKIDKEIEWMQEKMQGSWYSAPAINYYQTDSSIVTVVHNNFMFVYENGKLTQEMKFEIKYGYCDVCMAPDDIFYICFLEIDLETHESIKHDWMNCCPIGFGKSNFKIYQSFGYRETVYIRKTD